MSWLRHNLNDAVNSVNKRPLWMRELNNNKPLMQTELNKILSELHEIVELGGKITEAPWDGVTGECTYIGKTLFALNDTYEGWRDDATFIARSRNLTPKMAKGMIGMIKYLQGKLTYKPHRCEMPEYSEGYDMSRASEADDAREQLQQLITDWNKPI